MMDRLDLMEKKVMAQALRIPEDLMDRLRALEQRDGVWDLPGLEGSARMSRAALLRLAIRRGLERMEADLLRWERRSARRVTEQAAEAADVEEAKRTTPSVPALTREQFREELKKELIKQQNEELNNQDLLLQVSDTDLSQLADEYTKQLLNKAMTDPAVPSLLTMLLRSVGVR